MLYAIAYTLDERLGQTHNVLIRIQMTLEDLLAATRHINAKLDEPAHDYAYTPGDRDENGEIDIERARRLDDEAQDQEPDIDDEGLLLTSRYGPLRYSGMAHL